MARTSGTLIKLGIVAGAGFLALGEASKHGGIGPWINSLSGELIHGAGAANSALGTTVTQAAGQGTGAAAAPPAQHTGNDAGIGGSGVYQGTAAEILAAAQAAGVTSAAGGNSAKYGAALWSLQSQQAQPAYYQQAASVQATFASVAVTGG